MGPGLSLPEGVSAVAFDGSGQSFAAGSWDIVQVMTMPVPLPDDPPRITAWVQVVSGLELDERGSVQVLDAGAWQARRRRMQELGSHFGKAPDASEQHL